MEYIASPKNERVKQAKKLTVRKYQKQTGNYLLDGWHLVEEALAAGRVPSQIFATTKFLNERALKPFYDQMIEISPEVAQHLGDTTTPQGIFAVLPLETPSEDWMSAAQFLLLDGVQDPGNVGTLVRTADAAGVGTVILGRGSADAHNPKVLRAMQGSQFHVNVLNSDLLETAQTLKRNSVMLFGSVLDETAVDYRTVTAPERFALIVGNEGQGMSVELQAMTDQNLYVPIKGRAESLNVGIAAGVLLFHLIA